MSDVLDYTPEQWRQHRIARGWVAASNGAGKRHWFVTRETETGREYLDRVDGRLSWFASYESAKRRADAMNACPLCEDPRRAVTFEEGMRHFDGHVRD